MGAASYHDNYVFPVGGGPQLVSVAHTHHDYPAADIAALPKTTAVLISAGRTPGQLTLLPWYAERDAQQISEYAAEATAAVRTAAIAALGPANPLAQLLERQQRNGS